MSQKERGKEERKGKGEERKEKKRKERKEKGKKKRKERKEREKKRKGKEKRPNLPRHPKERKKEYKSKGNKEVKGSEGVGGGPVVQEGHFGGRKKGLKKEGVEWVGPCHGTIEAGGKTRKKGTRVGYGDR